MPKSKIAIQAIHSGQLPDDAIMIGEMAARQWKIPRGQPITLKFGSFRQTVRVMPVPKLDGLRISQTLAQRTGLLQGLTQNSHLGITYRSLTATLSLGPLIGVLISRDYPQDMGKPFGNITLFCRELVDACRARGAYVCFFTPGQIPSVSSSDQMESWIYSGGWRKTLMPFPDVINNRLTTRKLENDPSVQQFLKNVKLLHSAEVFNEKFLDKTEVFDALKKDSSLTRYLPESHHLRNYANLYNMCSRYNNVFLKPARGSLGKGIIRVSRADGESYQALYATAAGSRRQVYPTLGKLYSAVSTKMKTARYQIQQGLQLIDIQKRPVDFRALVQKNAAGKWTITSIVARTAGNQHFVSNLARGGTLSTVSSAIAKSNLSSGTPKLDAQNRLRRAALQIAKGIETQIPVHFGELGIDLALDTGGKVWLLEVNSKPSKNDNTPLTEGKIRPSVRMMIQYSRYLSGF
ncbi:YheC/YheD family protein [Paenibacillus sp. HB172176]|uniref:YheC/YheD family endospore coat-associated protein n=1 Tax=Paenibacillus sp. HB172176 TaxID=2493690 RepID=UPI00143A4B46|nr:YheC/YheD family protein [Paenibacillus sp. HB172176]